MLTGRRAFVRQRSRSSLEASDGEQRTERDRLHDEIQKCAERKRQLVTAGRQGKCLPMCGGYE